MVIKTILRYLADEINNYYPAVPSIEKFAKLGNIGRLESATNASNAELQKKVILTLVNIGEEMTLKNNPHYIRRGETLQKRNPILYLNLYVLISCADDDYENALTKISHVVSFFQEKNRFTSQTASSPFPSDLVDKIMLDLYSLNFEQMNHLWGVLGGKYHPSVLYRLRLVPIQPTEGEDAPEIREIKATENAN